MKQSLKSISIIIPTRNESRLIGHCLAAIPHDVELIVVDASDDDTPDVIKQLRPVNTTLIRSQTHIATARQIGAAAACGDWLVFSDADVVFGPGYFEHIHHYFHRDAFYGPKYATINHTVYSACFNSGQQICQVFGIPAASGSNMVVHRPAFEKAGGFRRDLPVNEDTELFLRLAHHGYRITYARDLAVRSLDDRRLAFGATRKMLHSTCRTALLWANLYIPMPKRWLYHDWGYWQKTRYRELAK